jgi:peptidoglycan/LPS O-acetylase OafA/YrhL
LSIEEAFYVGFPLACFAMLRRRFGMPAFIALLLAFVAVGPWARAVWAHTEIWQEKTYLGGMDAIALGCLTALVVSRLQESRSPLLNRARSLIALQLLGCAMMALVMAWPTWPWYKRAGHLLDQSTLYATILPLGVCFVMAATVLRGSRGALWTAPVRWFGRHSYEIYMTHEFVAIYGAYLMLRVHRGAPGTWAVAILLCTAPLGWAVARWLSEPANRALRGAAPPPRTVPSYA